MMSELTKEGIHEYQRGSREKAAKILAHALQINAQDEEAWYWLSACCADVEKKRYCLQRVLKINPHNAKAKRRLDRLDIVGELFVNEPTMTYRPRFSINRWAVVILGCLILAASLATYSIIRLGASNQGEIAAVLNQADRAPVLTIAPTDPPDESDISPVAGMIPVTGMPVFISGDGTEETEDFYLPGKKVIVTWQYIGQPDEERLLQQIRDQHRSIIQEIEEGFSTCIQEKQVELDFAIHRQDAEDIARFEQEVEICVQTYDQLKRYQNTKYYNALDKYSSSITIRINRRSKDDPITLIEMDGIYYGVMPFEAEEGGDYYLMVKASGPWSVRFE